MMIMYVHDVAYDYGIYCIYLIYVSIAMSLHSFSELRTVVVNFKCYLTIRQCASIAASFPDPCIISFLQLTETMYLLRTFAVDTKRGKLSIIVFIYR